jgi:NAD(P)-dependent dehydrogenase (short-subunit alcohol dehydrogenase family)
MSMQGKVVVVTGSNVGIGKETAAGLARLGATTVLACRNESKAEAAAIDIRRSTGNDEVQVVALDLSDLASVGQAADAILSRWDRLDVLVNNAGGVWTERHVTAQGFEQTFGVNHLGPFYLSSLLAERLTTGAPARIINVSSAGHHMAQRGMRFEDLQSERRYSGMEVYARSKLANVLFTRELARRLTGTNATVHAVHPGLVRSGFGMDGDMTGLMGLGNRIIRPFEISAAAGAKTSVYLASSAEVAGQTGQYWVRRKPGHMSRQARNDAQAARLWSVSEQLLQAAGFEAAF